MAYSGAMQRRSFLRAMLVGGLALGLASAHAYDPRRMRDDDALERARRAREEGRILPLEDIVARAEREFDARVIDVEIEDGHRDVEFVYEVKLLAADGRVVVAIYDAATGRLIKSRGHKRK